MNYIEECLEKFNNLPQELQDYLNSEKVIKTLEEIEEKYGIDLTLALILIFINELNLEDLPIYIEKKYNVNNDIINEVLFKMENGIFREIANSFNEDYDELIVEKDYLLDLSIEEKRDIISKIFSEKILDQFSLPEDHLLRLNAVIFELIGKDEQYLNKIIKYFLDSQEKISSKRIILKGKSEEPTISNWIKDFVFENSSDIFSPIILAKYLTSGKNVVSLNQDEKQILRQILKIYRNLIFFPESMGVLPYKDWEIFPINKDLLSIFNNKNTKKPNSKIISQSDKASEPQKITTKDDLNNTKNDLEQKISEEINLKNKELQELKDMIEKYPEKSLEKKAIKSEIKKRENKI